MKTNRRTQSKTMAIEDASPFMGGYNSTNSEEGSERSYESCEREAGLHGSDLEHWLAAEAGMFAERGI